MAGPGNILIKVGAEAGQAVRELATVDKALGKTMTTSEKMGAGIKKAAMPAAAVLGALAIAGVGAAKAAAEDAAAQEKLAGTLERVAGATKAQVAQTEDWIAGVSRATGVADDELRPALAKIATATGDVASAQKLLGKALDISAASGKGLDQVSVAIAKGYTGQTAALAKLVPGLSEASKESKNFGVIMDELGDKTGGAMAKQAETAAGSLQILKVQVAELQESMGAALLPVVQTLVPLFQRLADLAASNTGAMKALVVVIGALAAGVLVANAALKLYAAAQLVVRAATAAWTAAQWLLNAALAANPIGLVVVAIAALVAGLVLAYKTSGTFRELVSAAFAAVGAAARALGTAFTALLGVARGAFNWIADHWQVAAFAFGPIGVAVMLIASNFDKLKATALAVIGAITSAVQGLAGAIESVIAAVGRLIGWLSRIRVPKIDLPGPFLAPAPPPGAARTAPGALASSGGLTINISGALDPEGTARAIRRVLDRHERRNGRSV